MELNYGDVFASRSKHALGWAIRLVTKIKSKDDEATYNHTGIILGPSGRTMEALGTIKEGNLFEDYRGDRVLIARWRYMGHTCFDCGYNSVKDYLGTIYPWPRLLFHFIGLAKYIHWKTPVCSELTAKFLDAAGDRQPVWGINPDDLTDRWKIHKNYDIVWEGIVE